ncbi:hypothetical protein J2I47_11910 [Fibrella sp. HMF5335]|uniref:DUF2029 domain-containing protein n=1 Tax=Fibrella rubiginis TaxID=2817060 RepID=A0A939K1L1_9BACT|nr:hypothetical protein [Fibrella rubiginis]MBO0937252.1 hypothetical protein [Fibrella rubiginis]
MLILLVKAVASLVLTVGILLLLSRQKQVERYLESSKLPWNGVFFVLLRLAPFLLTYVVMGFEPQSDVQYFYKIVQSALRLEIPYLRALNPYSPFYGYMLALPVAIYKNSRMIVLSLLLFEMGCVWLTQRFFLPNLSRGERWFRCLIYYMLPVSFVFSVFSGQEDVLLWGAVIGAYWIWQRTQNAFLGGILMGAGLLLTKAIFVLLLIPIFFLTRRKLSFVAGAALIGLPVFVWLYLTTGTRFLDQPLHEGDYLKAPNWRSLLNPFFYQYLGVNGKVGKWPTLAILLAVIGLVTVWVRQRDKLMGYLPALYTAIFATMTVVQQSAISVYAYAFMLPLLFCLTNFRNRTQMGLLLAFNVLAANHPSIWWRMHQPYYNSVRAFSNPAFLAEYCLEWLVVAGFAWIAYRAMRQVRQGPVAFTPPPAPTPQIEGRGAASA